MAWKWQSLDLIHFGVPRSKHRILKHSKRIYSANDNLENTLVKVLDRAVLVILSSPPHYPEPLVHPTLLYPGLTPQTSSRHQVSFGLWLLHGLSQWEALARDQGVGKEWMGYFSACHPPASIQVVWQWPSPLSCISFPYACSCRLLQTPSPLLTPSGQR